MKFDPSEFDKLATYNSEVYRGLLHNERYNNEMRLLQIEYDKCIRKWSQEEVPRKLDDFMRELEEPGTGCSP